MFQRKNRSCAVAISLEDAQANVSIAEQELQDAESSLADVAEQPRPPTWKKFLEQEEASNNTETSDVNESAPTEQAITDADNAITSGFNIADQFPEAFQAILQGDNLTNMIVAVQEHKKYLGSGNNN